MKTIYLLAQKMVNFLYLILLNKNCCFSFSGKNVKTLQQLVDPRNKKPNIMIFTTKYKLIIKI